MAALGLEVARGDAGGGLGGALGRPRQGEIGGADRRDLDLQVDAVDQRASARENLPESLTQAKRRDRISSVAAWLAAPCGSAMQSSRSTQL